MNNESPMVSIVVAVFNHEKYIDQAIQSFLAQKVNFKIEILINDDASTDRSAERITEYQKKYPDVFRVFLQSENQYSKGKKPWFNVLFPNSRGKYIAICEGDDYWTDPRKLQEQVDFLENNPHYSAAAHNALVKHSSGAEEPFRSNFNSPLDLSVSDVIEGWHIPTASLMFKNTLSHEDIAAMSGWVSGDIPLAILLASKGPISLHPALRSVYRKHEGGVSAVHTRQSEQTAIDRVKMYASLNTYLKNKYVNEFKHVIGKRLWHIRSFDAFEQPHDLKLLLSVFRDMISELAEERNQLRNEYLEVPSILRSNFAKRCYSFLRRRK